jgi:hypothetical protein
MPHFSGLTAAAAVGIACLVIGAAGHNAGFVQARAQQSQPAAAPSTVSAAGITLHSVNVEFPNSDRMFPGSGDADAINNNCLACHSAGMVMNQPALTRSAWQQEVEKMRGQYKAPVDAADVPAIVAYLAAHKGTP